MLWCTFYQYFLPRAFARVAIVVRVWKLHMEMGRSRITRIFSHIFNHGDGVAWPRASASTTCHCNRGMATLAYEEVKVPSEEKEAEQRPSKASRNYTAVFLHGLMGSGRNWRTFARHLGAAILQQSPPNYAEWRMVLVDLRNHGRSAGLEGFDPPHDIPSAARDVADLIKAQNWSSPDVVIGHSLGGKVALDFVENCACGESVSLPKQLWVLDSVPGEVPADNSDGEVEKVLNTLQSLPEPIPSRRWLVDHLIKQGFSKTLSDWLGSNLKRVNMSSEEMTWGFHLQGIVEMFNSYRKKSYWPLLQHTPQGLDIAIVRGEKSDRWNPDVLAQLESVVSKEPNCNEGRVSYHVLKNAGHWVHMDNPKGLIDMMAPALVKLAGS